MNGEEREKKFTLRTLHLTALHRVVAHRRASTAWRPSVNERTSSHLLARLALVARDCQAKEKNQKRRQ